MSSKKPNKESILTAIVLPLTILAILTGCTAGNYGQLKSNPEARRAFEDYQILPNHKYYFRGSYNSPMAIVGIKDNYQLNLKLWVVIDPQSENFHKLIDKVSIQASGSTAHTWGFTIIDQAGNDIGIWYSAIRAATIQVDENNQIVMLSPIPRAAIGPQSHY